MSYVVIYSVLGAAFASVDTLARLATRANFRVLIVKHFPNYLLVRIRLCWMKKSGGESWALYTIYLFFFFFFFFFFFLLFLRHDSPVRASSHACFEARFGPIQETRASVSPIVKCQNCINHSETFFCSNFAL